MTLREREAPKARVMAYIKDPIYAQTGQARTFVELMGFRNVSTTISRTAPGSASITFPNYKSALIRYVSADTIDWMEVQATGASTTNSMGARYMDNITTAGVGDAFKGLWNDMTLCMGDTPMVNPAATADYLTYSRSRGDLMDGAKRNVQQEVNKQRLVLALPFLDMFDPIFVDYLGQDGFWYAGFTGLISKVSEVYNKTGDQSITISCKDLSCLFDNVSIVSGWNRMSVAEQQSNVKDFVYASETNISSSKFATFGSIFEKYNSITEIIETLVSTAQDMWRLENQGQQLFGEGVGVRAFKFQTSAEEYQGISGRRCANTSRAAKDYLQTDDNELDASNYFFVGEDSGLKHILIDPLILQFDQVFIHKLLNTSLALYKDSLKSADQILNDLVAKMYAYKYFDANGNLIIELARPNAFPNLVEYGGRSSATMIVHEVQKIVASKTRAKQDKKEAVLKGEGISDFIARVNAKYKLTLTQDSLIQLNGGIPKDGSYPPAFGHKKNKNGTAAYYLLYPSMLVITQEDTTNVLGDLKKNNVAPASTAWLTLDEESPKRLPTLPSGAPISFPYAQDYINMVKWATLNFHGKNYVLSSDDFQSFTADRDEGGLVTEVVIDAGFKFLELSGDIPNSNTAMHAVAVSDFDKLAKLGVRRYQAQSLYNVIWPSAEAGSRVLSYQAAAVLERMNASADNGTMSLNQRPDLQLGRTMINPLRMKSHLIGGITNSWSPGGTHNTSLSLSYGHSVSKTLEVPWFSIFAEPTVFFGPDGANPLAVFKKMLAVGADGKPETVKGDETYVAPWASNSMAPGYLNH